MKVSQMTMDEYLAKNPFNYSDEVLAQQKIHYDEMVNQKGKGFATYNPDFTEIITIIKPDAK